MRIPYFKGVLMRSELRENQNSLPRNECGIINLDDINGPGTHWVAYVKRGHHVKYYDSYGNLPPPREFIKYFGDNVQIDYNYERNQTYNSAICGQLCLIFLHHNT